MYFRILRRIVWFEVFEIDEFVSDFMDLEHVDPVSAKFETIGIDSKYFINNMGSFFLILVLDLVLILIWNLLVPMGKCCKFAKRIRKKLGRALFWNS